MEMHICTWRENWENLMKSKKPFRKSLHGKTKKLNQK